MEINVTFKCFIQKEVVLFSYKISEQRARIYKNIFTRKKVEIVNQKIHFRTKF